MMPKSKRLNLSNFEAQSIFRQSSKTQSPSFRYFFRTADQFRVAVVVPKKQVKLAVDRNLLKRRIYQILENINLDQFNIELVILLSSPPPPDYVSLEQEIGQGIEKITKKFEK